jgi:ribonuclease HII
MAKKKDNRIKLSNDTVEEIRESLEYHDKLRKKQGDAYPYRDPDSNGHHHEVGILLKEIDRLNILRASHLAMVRAVAGLTVAPDAVLIDGNVVPGGLTVPARAVVKGDARSLSIAAASIVAKTSRDAIMVDLAQQHPGYGWERNAGYPTPAHLQALRDIGPTPHHRRSFRPVHKILYQE